MSLCVRRPSGLLVPPEPRVVRSGLCDVLGFDEAMVGGEPSGVQTFDFVSNNLQHFVVPSVTRAKFKLWAAGGESLGATGGASAYIEAILDVTPGEILALVIGESGASLFSNSTAAMAWGGGARGGTRGFFGGRGGGYSAVLRGSTPLLVCGAGAGSGSAGGAGMGGAGGPSGQAGTAGTQGGGGSGATPTNGYKQREGGPGADGSDFGGGLYANNGGGGGGGYWGGHGGGGAGNTGQSSGGGGGGSNYADPGAKSVVSLAGDRGTPGNANDPDRGGKGSPDQHGRIVAIW